jgi:hypothetical protein
VTVGRNETERTRLISKIIGEAVYEEIAPTPGPNVVNLTPHEVCLVAPDCSNLLVLLVIPPTAPPARCIEEREISGIYGIPCAAYGGGVWPNVIRKSFSTVENLPDYVPGREGNSYIVSTLVAQALPERTDLFVVSDEVRDETGRIIACKALARLGSPESTSSAENEQ